MSKIETKTKTIAKDELYSQYNWFQQSFLPAVRLASDEFFLEAFDFQLISVSKNVNILFQGDDYFVTKIRIDKNYDAFFRFSESAISIILDRILGENNKFVLTNITELEAKIISSFNDYLFNNISKFLTPAAEKSSVNNLPQKKRKNFDTIHLTFFIKDKQSEESAKLIVSLPQALVIPKLKLTPAGEKFSVLSFNSSKLDVKIKIGTTKFYLRELKNLEKDDIVIFEGSNINTMKLIYKDYEKEFKITPNPGLVTSIDNDNGGYNMEGSSLSQSLWDDIQIEMGAEFEKVKITLGELRNIEQGLVLDLSSVYDNKISLKVEDKTIARGELVIINDRYGVKIDEVFASEKSEAEQISQSPTDSGEEEFVQPEEASENSDEEFDYSDFELDDQDI